MPAGSTAYPAVFDTDAVILQPDVADWYDDTDAGDETLFVSGIPHQIGDLTQFLRNIGAIAKGMQREMGINPSGTFADIAARLGAMSTCRKTADQTNSTVTPANITDLTFPVTIGADHTCEFIVAFSAAAATTGVGFDVTSPALGAAGYLSIMQQISGRAANPAVGGAMALTTVPYHLHSVASAGNPGASEGVAAAGAVYIALVHVVCTNPSAAGNIQLRWRSEVAAASTVKKGSFGRMYLN